MAADRTIILHVHLFKNAGTSFDAVLKRNFPGRWVTHEFPRGGAQGNAGLILDWVDRAPAAVAFSSHTVWGPLPQRAGLRVISALFLRDPLSRIRSAYRFERTQAGATTLGAQLAQTADFETYVRRRLATPGDRQCRDFQVERLARMLPGPEPEVDRAIRALDLVSFVGLVADFDGSMRRFARLVRPWFADFAPATAHRNRSEEAGASDETLSDDAQALLDRANAGDRALLAAAVARFATGAPAGAGAGAADQGA